jgi:tRNA A-37 threonylcarbamoyl transferase component Bud32
MSTDTPRCTSCKEPLEDAQAASCNACGAAVAPPSAVIGGRYRLLEKVAEGGMGTIYRAEQVHMGKVCALKVLAADAAVDGVTRRRFLQEARVVSSLHSPYTVQVFDCGETPDGGFYLAMEYLEGQDLYQVLRSQGPLSEAQVVAVGVQVLRSLEEAHASGVIHRDIKPANIMWVTRPEAEPAAKVLDFGIAKLSESEARKRLTAVTEFVGTPTYMSPEQARGDALDGRTDLYSLGASLFELVTGQPPFDAPTAMGVLTKHLHESPPRFATVAPDRVLSASLESVLHRALAKSPADRFAHAAAMREALSAVVPAGSDRGAPATAPPAPVVPRPSTARGQVLELDAASREDFDAFERSLKRRQWGAPFVGLLLLLAAGGGAWSLLAPGHPLGPPVPPPGAELTELEPNDIPDQATRIPEGGTARGAMGPARSREAPDVDLFRLDGDGGAVVVELTGVPDLNLVLDVSVANPEAGGNTRRLALVDDAPAGGSERLDALVLPRGMALFRVQERAWHGEPSRPAREQSRTPYTLTVRALEASPFASEQEPNDDVGQASALELSRPTRGYTGAFIPADVQAPDRRFSSVDIYAFPLDRPRALLVVPPSQGALVALDATDEGAARPGRLPAGLALEQRPARLKLPTGRSVALVRLQPASARTPAGAPYWLVPVTPEPEGLAPALAAAEALVQVGRGQEASELLLLAGQAFKQAPWYKSAVQAAQRVGAGAKR